MSAFEHAYLEDLRSRGKEILQAIRTDKQITAETEEKLKSFLQNFSKVFVPAK